MSSKADLVFLEQKLSAATGPSRELDMWIAGKIADDQAPWSDADCEYAAANHQRAYNAAHFTASLDAAIALVERVTSSDAVERPFTGGWSWRVGNTPSGKGFAFLGVGTKPHDAATPALALCLALVRSLQKENEPS